MVQSMENVAFIDGQNLYISTTGSKESWRVDLHRLREFLARQYLVGRAYYFVGQHQEGQETLYDRIQDAGFILVFRPHLAGEVSEKKGNVDTDIVFMMMREYHENPKQGKIVLVSGDGDYFRTVFYLNERGKMLKLLFPSYTQLSQLYQRLPKKLLTCLSSKAVKKQIIYERPHIETGVDEAEMEENEG